MQNEAKSSVQHEQAYLRFAHNNIDEEEIVVTGHKDAIKTILNMTYLTHQRSNHQEASFVNTQQHSRRETISISVRIGGQPQNHDQSERGRSSSSRKRASRSPAMVSTFFSWFASPLSRKSKKQKELSYKGSRGLCIAKS